MYRIFLDYIMQLARAEDAAALQNALKVIAEGYELPTFAYLLMPDTTRATPKLITPREYECLNLAAQGKSAWDISRILNISQHSAEFHLANVHAKRDVHASSDETFRA